MVVLLIFGRGGEGSKPHIVVLRRAISFTPHCLCICGNSKSRSSFLPGVYVMSHSEKGKHIYCGLTNSTVGPFRNEINNQLYINWFSTYFLCI